MNEIAVEIMIELMITLCEIEEKLEDFDGESDCGIDNRRKKEKI